MRFRSNYYFSIGGSSSKQYVKCFLEGRKKEREEEGEKERRKNELKRSPDIISLQPHLNIVVLVQVPHITLIEFWGPSVHIDKDTSCSSLLQCQPMALLILASDISDLLWVETQPCICVSLMPSGSMRVSTHAVIWSLTYLLRLILIS